MYTSTGEPEQTPKKNSNVIYFLIVVILALLGTDVYLYMKKNTSEEKYAFQSDQQSLLKTELDSLESQVEQVNAGKTRLSAEMTAKNDSLKAKIKTLRVELAKGKLTTAELVQAQEDVKQLRYFVTKYTADIEELKQQNATLTTERDTLKTNLNAVSAKANDLTQQTTNLQKQNQDLNTKVQIASAIKMGAADVKAYKVRGSGKEVDVTRASPAKRIKVTFTIASNSVAQKGPHYIYMRVLDPSGALLGANGATFQADGQDLQYTFRTSIDFKDDGAQFPIEWENPNPFVKGAYTVILYADGFTMGKTGIVLK